MRLTSTAAVMTFAELPATCANLASACFSRSPPRSAMQIFMPALAKRVAAASPMPEAPPVTTATLLGDIAAMGIFILRNRSGTLSQARIMAAAWPLWPWLHGKSSRTPTAARLYGSAPALYSHEYNDPPTTPIDTEDERESNMAVTQAIPITRHPYADGSYKQMLIDGKWVDAASGKKFETLNPATGELLATVAEGDAEDINRAVAAARRAFEGPWSKVKPYERQNLLLKLADLVEKHFEELSQLDTLDMGAPISRTRGNRLRVLGMLRYYAGQATALHGETIENSLPGEIFSYTLKEPIGVVGAIIPWNGPLAATVWKIGPAIATGCTVVLKPAEEAPLTSLRLAELAMEAGIPPGVVNVVPGYGETAGAALASHPGVDKVAFTGSHVTG